MLDQQVNIDEVMAKLAKVLPVDRYGRDGANTWSYLQEQIEKGECRIQFGINDKPLREVKVVRVFIFCKGMRLIEAFQEFTSPERKGEKKYRNQVGLSEKVHPKERSIDAAYRAVQEEMGISLDDGIDSIGIKYETKESNSLPGLRTQYQFFDFRLDLPEEFFRKEYQEICSDKVTVFQWEPAQNLI